MIYIDTKIKKLCTNFTTNFIYLVLVLRTLIVLSSSIPSRKKSIKIGAFKLLNSDTFKAISSHITMYVFQCSLKNCILISCRVFSIDEFNFRCFRCHWSKRRSLFQSSIPVTDTRLYL